MLLLKMVCIYIHEKKREYREQLCEESMWCTVYQKWIHYKANSPYLTAPAFSVSLTSPSFSLLLLHPGPSAKWVSACSTVYIPICCALWWTSVVPQFVHIVSVSNHQPCKNPRPPPPPFYYPKGNKKEALIIWGMTYKNQLPTNDF